VNVVWGAVILVLAVGAAVGVMLFVRRRAPEGSYFSDGDRASGVFGVLATGFAIFAGFVIFLAFTSYDQSRSGAEAEAITLVQQYETAQFLPADVRHRLTGELICYGRSVVNREWPLMERGDLGNSVNPWGVALFRTLKLTNPSSAPEQSAYDKWLDQTSERELARQDRIHGASGITPTSVWIVLFFTAAVVFVYMLFFADSGELPRSQAMLVGSATAVMVVTLLVINALDNPYAPGVGSIQPGAMERSLGTLDEARMLIEDVSPVPCDEDGTARD
jgi:hypothetical protein